MSSETGANDTTADRTYVDAPEPVHFSQLKKMRLSPAHFREAEDASTSSTRKGDGTHSVLLGSKPVVVFEGGVRYSVECRVRFAITEGVPAFSFTMHRRKEIERDAFNAVRLKVGEQTKRLILAGTP